MHAQIREIDPVTVEIQVEVPWDRVRRSLDETFAKLQRSAHVKGFRPGKAPRSVLRRLFSKNVHAEVVSSLVDESVAAAVKQHELPVVSNAMLERLPEITEGQPLSFKVRFEVRPKVAELRTDLALTRRVPAVSDAEVDAEIERLRKEHAIERPVEEARPARKGDVLVIDCEVEIDGELKPGMKSADRTVLLGEGQLLDEIESGLVGAKVGEVREIRVERPADDGHPEIAGKKVLFKVSVKDLRERILPELDDEFAKDAQYETLLELRLDVRKRLEEAAKVRAEVQLRQQAVEKLVDANPIPVPPSLVDAQMHSMARTYVQLMDLLGRKPSLDRGGFEELRKHAEHNVRAVLLIGELARRASISVGTAEVEAKMADIAARSGRHIAKIRAEYTGEKREALESQLLQDKVVRYLLDRAVIRDAPADEPASESAGSASPSP